MKTRMIDLALLLAAPPAPPAPPKPVRHPAARPRLDARLAAKRGAVADPKPKATTGQNWAGW